MQNVINFACKVRIGPTFSDGIKWGSLSMQPFFRRIDMKNLGVLSLTLLAFWPAVSEAAMKTETITYKVGDKTYKGFLAYDDASTEKRPGILVVHEFWGLNEYARKRAEQLAGL